MNSSPPEAGPPGDSGPGDLIGTLERGYRIAAFIVLGAILLAVSFFYQRSRMRTAE